MWEKSVAFFFWIYVGFSLEHIALHIHSSTDGDIEWHTQWNEKHTGKEWAICMRSEIQCTLG